MTRRGAVVMAALVGLCGTGLCPVPTGAETVDNDDRHVPPPDYFTGVYERVGRDGATPPGLVNDFVRLAPDDLGGLMLWTCGPGRQAEPIHTTTLRFDRFGDVANLLSTPEGDTWIGCQFFNTMDNYAALLCEEGTGGRFTLWPADDPAICPGND
jgi:hypothetical protein